jgi:hypothetical protein
VGVYVFGVIEIGTEECHTGVPVTLSIRAMRSEELFPSKRKYSAAAVPKECDGWMEKRNDSGSGNSNQVMGLALESSWSLGMTHTLLYCPTSEASNMFAVM